MKFIIKLFPEITIKSKSVRQRMVKVLQGNIRNVLQKVDETVTVRNDWDKLVVSSKNDSPENRDLLVERLSCTPGIQAFLEVTQKPFTDLHSIYEQTAAVYGSTLVNKTFCVRVKRKGKHEFSSIEIERYVGGGLNQNFPSNGVKLSHPDLQINLQIEDDQLYLVTNIHKGLGGYPLSTQEDVLSLISGGFDSGVASYQFIKRGSRVHYCFFNLGGAAHEIGVKQVSYYLWSKYGQSHRVKFISVPFEPVVGEILEKIDNGLMGVVLKRMMMRAASRVAERLGIEALVTGESVGQVSSQTVTNLSVIDRVTETLILRPLIVSDKQDIIDQARAIGTLEFAETMPEYCGVISNKPNVKAPYDDVLANEAKFNFDVLEEVIANSKLIDIRDIANETAVQVQEVETTSALADNEVILDIRSPDDHEDKPFEPAGMTVIHLPFYKLSTQFGDLDQSKTYLLYCERGVMSKLQALYLKEQGFNNIKVYRQH
jgi:thiazole biosynthesis/tRNA modification protein ThiI